ncbi:hypothetical protein WG906_16000 [Pedobacter sp. P351]|uniref:hypothetical protein n=1 Tax=Pedobacter superstes TaxID=3133441 RepID=UPI00309BE1D3
MNKLFLIALLFLGIGTAIAQEISMTNGTTLVTIDSKTFAVPDMSKMPWFGEEKLGRVNLDTIKVTLIMAQIRTETAELSTGNLIWRKGYYIATKNIFLDEKKKPISNLFHVLTTLPALPSW